MTLLASLQSKRTGWFLPARHAWRALHYSQGQHCDKLWVDLLRTVTSPRLVCYFAWVDSIAVEPMAFPQLLPGIDYVAHNVVHCRITTRGGFLAAGHLSCTISWPSQSKLRDITSQYIKFKPALNTACNHLPASTDVNLMQLFVGLTEAPSNYPKDQNILVQDLP